MHFCIKGISAIVLLLCFSVSAQIPLYPDSGGVSISHVSFNKASSEFCPTMYRGKLYFISDRDYYFGVVTFSNGSTRQFYDIYSAEKKDSVHFEKPLNIQGPLNTKLNDGPICITEAGVYITSNNENAKRGKKEKAPLQILFARHSNNSFSKPERVSFFLDDTISTGLASVVNDTLMYLVSDMRGGYGGADIYVSRNVNGVWQKPVNCGPVINSEYNELFPHYKKGVLYFSSDRPGGFGKLDLYAFKQNKDSIPKLLAAPLNGKADDFGIFLEDRNGSGYFSSDRDNTDDVFQFSFDTVPLFSNCKEMTFNNYCFTFFEENAKEDRDTANIYYEWSFGDGKKMRGAEVYHCFDGAGKYLVELNVIDKNSGTPFYNQLSYEFNLKNEEQLYIDMPDTVKAGEEVLFNYSYSMIPGFRITKAAWDLGTGKIIYGSRPSHIFNKPGEYIIRLSTRGSYFNRAQSRCITRKLTVLDFATRYHRSVKNRIPKIKTDQQELISRIVDSILLSDPKLFSFIRSMIDSEKGKNDSLKFMAPSPSQASIDSSTLSYTDLTNGDMNYRVHIGSSAIPLNPGDPVFKGLDSISEIKTSSLYQYFYGKYKSPKMALSAVQKVRAMGFSPFLFPFEKDSLSNLTPSLAQHLLSDTLVSSLDSFTVIVYFKFNDYHLADADRADIETLVDRFCKSDCEFILSGYADSKGTDDYNLQLSKKRLKDVSRVLHSKGVDKKKITIRPIGKIRISEQETDAIRSQERKVEITFIVK